MRRQNSVYSCNCADISTFICSPQVNLGEDIKKLHVVLICHSGSDMFAERIGRINHSLFKNEMWDTSGGAVTLGGELVLK